MSVCYTVVGATQTGKTTQTREIMKSYNDVIVYDVQDQYTDLPLWKRGMKGHCRILSSDMRYLDFVKLGKMLTKTLFINEESSRFVNANMQTEITDNLVDKAHTKNRYLFIFHGFNPIPPKLLLYTDYLVQFRTGVSDAKHVKSKTKNDTIIRCYEKLEVMPRYSKFVHKISALSCDGVF